MALADTIRSILPFLRSAPRLPPDLVRNLHPARNPEAKWSRETRGEGDAQTDLVVIFAPRPPSQGWMKLLARFIGEPTGRKVELSDEIASDVWELCDGRRTVAQICGDIAAKYKLGERQTEVSVLQFLNMLRTRRLIGLPEQEQAAIETAAARGRKRTASKAQAAEAAQERVRTDGNSHAQQPKRTRARRARRH